jgi:REP element-mobilizing transposase RayT
MIIDSPKFRVKAGQLIVGTFVIMPNHMHLIWWIQNELVGQATNENRLSQYATGKKKPSPKQTEKILEGIHEVGRELTEINLV